MILLAETDKFMVVDFPITELEQEQYRQYRQYLRDLPRAADFPNLVISTFEEWKRITWMINQTLSKEVL